MHVLALDVYQKYCVPGMVMGLLSFSFTIGSAAIMQSLSVTQQTDSHGHTAYYFSNEQSYHSNNLMKLSTRHHAKAITTNNWPYQECLLLTDLAPYCDQYLRQH